jgi:hypothetical protein
MRLTAQSKVKINPKHTSKAKFFAPNFLPLRALHGAGDLFLIIRYGLTPAFFVIFLKFVLYLFLNSDMLILK